MCPLCIATGTLVLASAGSAGGLVAVAAKILKKPVPDRDARPRTVPAKAA